MAERQWECVDQQKYISRMEKHMESLRKLAELSQAELASILGLSRQTYSQLASGKRRLSWRNYLGLVFVFDSHAVTRELLHLWGIYPNEFVSVLNER